MDTKDIEIKTVIKIDPSCKYVFVTDRRLSDFEYKRVTKVIEDWWKSDIPFLLVDEGVRLEKVSESSGA